MRLHPGGHKGKEFRKMQVLVPGQAEPATALELGQPGEARGRAQVWDWAEHPARLLLVPALVTSSLPLQLRHGSRTIINLTATAATAVDDVVQLEHRASIVHGAAEGDDVTIRVAPCEFYIRATYPHVKAVALETIRDEIRVPDKVSACVLVDFQRNGKR